MQCLCRSADTNLPSGHRPLCLRVTFIRCPHPPLTAIVPNRDTLADKPPCPMLRTGEQGKRLCIAFCRYPVIIGIYHPHFLYRIAVSYACFRGKHHFRPSLNTAKIGKKSPPPAAVMPGKDTVTQTA